MLGIDVRDKVLNLRVVTRPGRGNSTYVFFTVIVKGALPYMRDIGRYAITFKYDFNPAEIGAIVKRFEKTTGRTCPQRAAGVLFK